MLLPLASLSDVIPLAATTDTIPPFFLFFGRHTFCDVLNDARPKPLQKPHAKLNPKGRPLGY
jgi:hypothetical protein